MKRSSIQMQILVALILLAKTTSERCTFVLTTNLPSYISTNDTETIQEVDVKTLQIANGNLPLITRNTFKRYKNLEKLAVVNSNLTQIERGAFNDLAHLSEIDLSNNSLKRFTSDVFPKNNRLKMLILSGNTLESLNGFRHFVFKLNKLDVSNNILKRLPTSIVRRRRSLQIIAGNNPFWECENLSSSDVEYEQFQKKFCTRSKPIAMRQEEKVDKGCNFMLCTYWMVGSVPCGIVIGNTWAILKCIQKCCCRRKIIKFVSVGVQYEKVDLVPPPRT